MADEPSPSELKRIIERNHSDSRDDYLDLKAQLTQTTQTLSTQLERYVLLAVYMAEQRAQDDRIRRLEDSETATKRGNRSAVLAAVASFVAAIAVVIVTAAIGH